MRGRGGPRMQGPPRLPRPDSSSSVAVIEDELEEEGPPHGGRPSPTMMGRGGVRPMMHPRGARPLLRGRGVMMRGRGGMRPMRPMSREGLKRPHEEESMEPMDMEIEEDGPIPRKTLLGEEEEDPLMEEYAEENQMLLQEEAAQHHAAMRGMRPRMRPPMRGMRPRGHPGMMRPRMGHPGMRPRMRMRGPHPGMRMRGHPGMMRGGRPMMRPRIPM